MTVYSIDPVGRGDFEHLEQMTRLSLPYSNSATAMMSLSFNHFSISPFALDVKIFI